MTDARSFNYLQRNWPFFAAVIAGAILMMVPAFYNGYPLLNPDDGTYISSGFIPDTPNDRPIIYGLLLRIFSLNGVSLWLALCCQAYIVSWLVFRITQHIAGKSLLPPLLVIFCLSAGSSLSWNVSELIPDIFTTVALMCIVLIVTGRESKTVTGVLYALYFVAVATHMAHVLLFSLLLVLLWLVRKRIPALPPVRVGRRVLVLLLLTIATVAVMGSALSKSRHVFMMGALLTRGVLKPILDDKCATAHFKLCAYKDALPPDANEFIWNSNSPLYKEGGWEANKEEYNRIIHISLTEPAYIQLQVKSSLLFTGRQLASFRIGDGNWVSPPGDYLHETIRTYLRHELPAFDASRQNTGRLQASLQFPNRLMAIIVIISLIILAAGTLFAGRRLNRLFYCWLALSTSGLLLNAWSCGTFSEITGRYGSKMVWLVMFNALLCLLLVRKPKPVK